MEVSTAKNFASMQTMQELGHAKKGLIYGLISGTTWGLNGVILGMALAMAPFTGVSTLSLYAGPLASAAMHDGFAGFWLFFYNLFTGRAREYFRTLRTRPGKIVVLAALFGGPIAMSGYLMGINMAGASYTLAITAMYPAVGAILAIFVLKEKIIPRIWAGIILCVGGAVIVGYVPPVGVFPNFYLGLAFSLLASLGWGMEGVLSTYGMDMVDPDIAIGIREATSFFVYLVGLLPLVAGLVVFWDAFWQVSVYYVAGAGALGALSYWCWYRALNMTGVGRAMALNVTYSLWAVFFSWLLIPGFQLTVTLVQDPLNTNPTNN